METSQLKPFKILSKIFPNLHNPCESFEIFLSTMYTVYILVETNDVHLPFVVSRLIN